MTNDVIALPSGRRLDANMGFVGINVTLDVTGGCDHPLEGADLYARVEERYSEPKEYDHLPASDKHALAEIMISRWRLYQTIAAHEERSRWVEIEDLPSEEMLVIAGSYNGKGEWCAEVVSTTYLRENRAKIAAGVFKGSEHLMWDHTHWIHLAMPPRRDV